MSHWRETASELSLGKHRPVDEVRAPPRRGGCVQFEGGGPGEFADDMARWRWEELQWKHHKDLEKTWLDGNGHRIFGPPIYPEAVVVERNSYELAVEQAEQMGFVLGRAMWTQAFKRPWPLPMQLECVRKVANQQPHIVRCVIRVPLLDIEGVTQHIRCFDLQELVAAYLDSPEAPILRKRFRAAWIAAQHRNAKKRISEQAKKRRKAIRKEKLQMEKDARRRRRELARA